VKNLQRDSKYHIYYALSFDEIYIRKQVTFDKGTGKFVGFTDYGGVIENKDSVHSGYNN